MNLKGNKSTQLKKKAVLQALENTLGVVTHACQKAGVGRKTFYEWLQKDEDFKKTVQDIDNVVLDFAESKLYSQIKGEQHHCNQSSSLKTKRETSWIRRETRNRTLRRNQGDTGQYKHK